MAADKAIVCTKIKGHCTFGCVYALFLCEWREVSDESLLPVWGLSKRSSSYGEAFEICSIEKSDKYLVQLFEIFYTRERAWSEMEESGKMDHEV